MVLKEYLLNFCERIRNYFSPPKHLMLQYSNALHEGGVGGKPANKVRSLAEKLPGEERKIALRRFNALDEVFTLKEEVVKKGSRIY